jgi:ribonuclease P protein component
VKRLLREAVRPLYTQLVAQDIVIAARAEVARAEFAGLRDELADAVARAGLIRSDTK